MKRKYYLIVLFALMNVRGVLFAAAPPIMEWQKCLGGSLQDIPSALIKSVDGGTILLSNVDSHNGDISYNHGSTDIWLSKFDVSGKKLWEKSFGGNSIDVGTGISELQNGNIIISGYTSSLNGDFTTNKGNFDVFLLCADNSGKILWNKTYGGSQVDLCYSQILSSDGGFILGGGSYSNDGDLTTNHGDQDFWLMKTDAAGNLLWQHSSGGSGIDVCYSLAKDASGNIYACGTTNSTNGDVVSLHGNYDVWVIKFDESGNLLWNKTYGGTNYETAQSILIDSHQNILVGGYTRSLNGDITDNYGYGDCWIIQVDETGNLLKQKNFGGSGSDNLYSIIETSDGGYLFTNATSSDDINIKNHFGKEDIWLYKTDRLLNEEWSRNFGGSGNDRPVCVIQNADGGYRLAGYTFSNDGDISGQHGSADIWLISLVCKIPTAFFSTQFNACLGDTINLTNASTYASLGTWTLNNVPISTGNSTQITFPSIGDYEVALNVQTCYYSSNFTAHIDVTNCNLPIVNFTVPSSSICVNGLVTFSDVSTKASSWLWQFPGGNPSTSSLQNPVISYSQPGNYNVMLTVTNSYGSQSAMRLNFITVNALPPAPVITINGDELISTSSNHYQWYFNNAPVSYATSQTLLANDPGYYQVMVQDNNHCVNVSNPVYYSLTGISEEKELVEFSVFPNPTANKLNVNIPKNYEGTISLINMNGQKLFEKNIVKNESQLLFDLLQYPTGVYKVMFTDNKGNTIQKSIIIN